MTQREALDAARAAGFAEADPSADLSGADTTHKLAILIQHAFDVAVTSDRIRHHGITRIGSGAVRRARQHGFEIVLLGYARRCESVIAAETGPALVPFSHPFARLTGEQNAVQLSGTYSGTLTFTGPGAGRYPAAAAVVGDAVAALRVIASRERAYARIAHVPAPDVHPAFDRFPAFAGLPVLRKDTSHVDHSGIPALAAL